MRVSLRTRVNGRLPDKQEKFRDEVTQEVTIEVDGSDYPGLNLSQMLEVARKEMGRRLFESLLRLSMMGGADYSQALFEALKSDLKDEEPTGEEISPPNDLKTMGPKVGICEPMQVARDMVGCAICKGSEVLASLEACDMWQTKRCIWDGWSPPLEVEL